MNFEIKDIGKSYKDFVLISVEELKDYKSKGIYLRHKKTGLELYHVINDDSENLFSFNFRTLSKNSKGTAHIIEHSTLCGSEKFPLKEPFSTLENQSLNTFLNAMTSPEKTMYPAASLVKADYYNLMDVYSDAVFFPKLTRQTFMQEGWRIEFDENDKPSIQGVVYNEMKANYTTFNQIAIKEFFSAIYPDSYMDYDSGGNPLEIPELTYEEFLDFHKKFYIPSNCLLILYGNIPTKEQIDFIDEKLINRLIEKFGVNEPVDLLSETPILTDEIKTLTKINRIENSKEVTVYAPDNGTTGNITGLCWYCGKTNIEQIFLNELLAGIDSSPLSKILQESKLGDDEAPISGPFSYVLDEGIISYGLSGVKTQNKDKVYKLIFDSLNEIYKKGFNQNDIDAAIMGIDFNLREEKRFWDPRSINISSKITTAWCIGRKPSDMLWPITSFEKVKQQIKENPDYIPSLMRKYFLDNKLCLKFNAVPSKNYFAEKEKVEKALLNKLVMNIDKEKYKKEIEELHQYQQKEETEEELKCIPYLKTSEIQTEINHIKSEYLSVKNSEGKNIPLIFSKEKTNGLVYFNVAYPIDNIEPEKLVKIPLFTSALGNLGWNGKPWDECISKIACTMGDFTVRLKILNEIETSVAEEKTKNYPEKRLLGRVWINFEIKCVIDKVKESLDLFSDILSSMDFEDVKHFENIFIETKTSKKEGFVSNASSYLTRRALLEKNKYSRISEIFFGITQFLYLNKLTKKAVPTLLKEYKDIYKSIISQGGILQLITDEDSLPIVIDLLPAFVSKINLTEIKEKIDFPLKRYDNCIYYPRKYDKKINTEVIKVDTQSNYSIMTFLCSPFCTKEAAAEELLSNYLSGHQLWDKIRMTGGAYGGSAQNDSADRIYEMKSWRDPKPFKSLEVFLEVLEEMTHKTFTKEDIERSVLSCYASFITPDSPSNRGFRGINRYLRGNDWELLEKQANLLFEVTPKDMHNAAVRLFEYSKNNKSVVFCDKKNNSCGNILKIKL